jgi:hypothetical protein
MKVFFFVIFFLLNCTKFVLFDFELNLSLNLKDISLLMGRVLSILEKLRFFVDFLLILTKSLMLNFWNVSTGLKRSFFFGNLNFRFFDVFGSSTVLRWCKESFSSFSFELQWIIVVLFEFEENEDSLLISDIFFWESFMFILREELKEKFFWDFGKNENIFLVIVFRFFKFFAFGLVSFSIMNFMFNESEDFFLKFGMSFEILISCKLNEFSLLFSFVL